MIIENEDGWFRADEWWENSHYDDVPVKRLSLISEPYDKDYWASLIYEALCEFVSKQELDSICLLANNNFNEGARLLYEVLANFSFVVPGKVQYTRKNIPAFVLEDVYSNMFEEWFKHPEFQEIGTLLL